MTEYTAEQIKKNRRKWVKALRSGEYEQTTKGILYSDGKHCCLGVLCEVAGIPRNRIMGGTLMSHSNAMNFVGLADEEGMFGGGYLTRLNDQGTSFKEIADIIESEPEGLFNPL